jgi:hypothetical protein
MPFVLNRFILVTVLCLPAMALGQHTIAPETEGSGVNHIVSNVPGNFTAGTNVNNLLGADRFYNAGFSGQGTIVANVEAGHVWNGHEALTHVTQFTNHPDAFGTVTADLFDRHATWVASHIGGRMTAVNGGAWQTGIAPDTDLRSGAIAAQWGGNAYSLAFNFTTNSFLGGYAPHFGTADVINSSWGGTSPSGNNYFAVLLDGLAAQNSQTTHVTSAGNAGPGANTVGFPGSGYNAITVGALANGGNNSYNTMATFSSRGPQDYFDPVNGLIVNARAAVDISAPGTNLHAAFYGGQTGGNNTSLPGSTNSGTNPNFYSFAVAGTSFASPIVAGGVALLKSASYNTAGLAGNAASRDTLVIKSVLMNSADKTVGWSNGQVANGFGGVDTTQALDFAAGAGALNLSSAFDQYLNAGTQDVIGLANGDLGIVDAVGWDLGNVTVGDTNLYSIGGLLEGGSQFNVTLNWFRNREFDEVSRAVFDLGQADLTLQVLDLTTNSVIAQSASLFNTSEHLSFLLPTTSQYGIGVFYGGNTFGAMTNVNYGIAWSGFSVVPEPSTLSLLVILGTVVSTYRRRQVVA